NAGIQTASAVLVDEQTADLSYEMYRNLNFHLDVDRELARYRDVDAQTELRGIGLRATYTARRALELSAFVRYEVSKTNRSELVTDYDALRTGLSARVRL